MKSIFIILFALFANAQLLAEQSILKSSVSQSEWELYSLDEVGHNSYFSFTDSLYIPPHKSTVTIVEPTETDQSYCELTITSSTVERIIRKLRSKYFTTFKYNRFSNSLSFTFTLDPFQSTNITEIYCDIYEGNPLFDNMNVINLNNFMSGKLSLKRGSISEI